MNLPKIYKNQIDDEIRNSQYTYYSKDHRLANWLDEVPVEVIIETKNRLWQTKIIGKTDHYIVTSDGEVINFNDCLSIKKRP